MNPADIIPLRPVPRAEGLPNRSDDELMELARADVRAAFEVLVQRHVVRLCSFCIKMLGDRRAGEDAAQDTWMNVWKRRAAYTPSGKFEPFLYRVARNRCRNAARSTRRRGRVHVDWFPDHVEPPSKDPSHLDQLLSRERRGRVYEALTRLPAKQREAILLRFEQELDYADIARVVGRSESTVRSRVHHGVRKLRAMVDGGDS